MTNKPASYDPDVDQNRINADGSSADDTSSAHFGADENQVVPVTPPTQSKADAEDQLIENPYDDDPDRSDELTPG